MLTSLAGRSIIVTGASKGIGKGIARVFCQNGAKVLVVSRHIDEAAACMHALQHEVLASQDIPAQGTGREPYRS